MSLADLRPALRAYLLADAAISSVVGGVRVHPVILPQGETRASLVYNLVSEVNDHHTQGASGLVMARIQIDAWAGLADTADSLARLVKERIDGYRGLMGAVQIQGVFAETAFTSYEDDPKLFRVGRDYLIHFEER